MRGIAALPVASLLCLLCSAASATEGTRVHRYTVEVDPALNTISVRACFSGTAPRYLVAKSLDAAAALESAQIEGVTRRLEPNGAELKLGAVPDNACLRYRATIGQVGARHDRTGNLDRHVGGDLITDVGLWLWRPNTLADDEDIEIRFEVPAGLAVSAPWRVVDDAPSGRVYRLGRFPYDWPTALAIGHFTEQHLDVPGARIRFAVLDSVPEVPVEEVSAWLARAATAVTTVYGRFPVPELHVLVIPGARGNEPIPSAYVVRGGGAAVHFFINQRRPLAEFLTDWTAVHEFSHLLLPDLNWEGAWLSEGLATYYQNVLRARAEMIEAEDAWRQLHRGFRIGMRIQPGVTLARATERMYRDGPFQRVYWEGAAIMLLADLRLRSLSSGEQSLDVALKRLNECCLAPSEGWRTVDLIAKLDALTGTKIFQELYDQYVGAEGFPDLSEAYTLLGLEIFSSGERVELRPSAAPAGLREAIMTPASP